MSSRGRSAAAQPTRAAHPTLMSQNPQVAYRSTPPRTVGRPGRGVVQLLTEMAVGCQRRWTA